MDYWESKHYALWQRLEKHYGGISKENPYHDEIGRFTSADRAVTINGVPVREAAQVGSQYERKKEPEGWNPDKPFADPARERVLKVLAGQLRGQAIEHAPEITAQMVSFANEAGGEMSGLDFAVKGAGSMTRKIRDRMHNRGLTAEESQAKIKDALRYTFMFSDDNYASGVESAVRSLVDAGWTLSPGETLEDYWGKVDDYSGLNSVWTPPNVERIGPSGNAGAHVEIQFHTEQSFFIKETQNHAAFEEYRNLSDSSPLKKELYARMSEPWANYNRGEPPSGWPPAYLSEVGITEKAHPAPEGYFHPEHIWDAMSPAAQARALDFMPPTIGQSADPASGGGPTRWGNAYGSGYVQGVDERQTP